MQPMKNGTRQPQAATSAGGRARFSRYPITAATMMATC